MIGICSSLEKVSFKDDGSMYLHGTLEEPMCAGTNEMLQKGIVLGESCVTMRWYVHAVTPANAVGDQWEASPSVCECTECDACRGEHATGEAVNRHGGLEHRHELCGGGAHSRCHGGVDSTCCNAGS
jgi:hypothetical protein